MSEGVALSSPSMLSATSSAAGMASSPATTVASPRFACPYFKMFGRQGIKGRSCTGEGFPDVHRIKGHLYRLHEPPISCPRCYAEFKDQSKVIVHLRREAICELISAPSIDETTTFTEAQRQELKRRLSKKPENSNEEEQCKEMYRILFPQAPLPDSLYVTGHGSQPKLDLQAGITTALVDLLLIKVPSEAKYADLGSKLKAFLETAHATGFMDEAAHVVAQRHKRRRVSQDISFSVPDGSRIATPYDLRTMTDTGCATLSTAEEESSLSPQLSEKLLPHPMEHFPIDSWSFVSPEDLDSAPGSSFGLDASGQANNGSYVELRDNFLWESQPKVCHDGDMDE